MALKNTPGVDCNIEGKIVYLSFKQDDAKGEPESESFRVNTFLLSKNELKVALWRKKKGQLFEATFHNHKEVIPDHAVSIEVISDTLKQILTGTAENVQPSVGFNNDQYELVIKSTVEAIVFGKVIFNFCYRLPMVKMALDKRNEMRIEEIERAIEDLKFRGSEEEDGKVYAKFDATSNTYTTLEKNGSIMWHSSGGGSWNTTPVNFEMGNENAFRARFRVMSHVYNNLMFGIISNSYVGFNTCPSAGHHGWMIHFHSNKVASSQYIHNGSFSVFPNSCAPWTGSIITVEFFPRHGRIQFSVNNLPAGQCTGCSFQDKSYGFAVSHYDLNTKVKLLSIERIEDFF